MQKMLEPFQLFDADRCKEIIRLAQLQKLQSGRVGNGEIPREDTQVRKNSVSFIEFDTETRGIMWGLLLPYIQDHEVKYLEHPYRLVVISQESFITGTRIIHKIHEDENG